MANESKFLITRSSWISSKTVILLGACASGLALYYYRRRNRPNAQHQSRKRPNSPSLNIAFLKQLYKLIRISIPGLWTKEFGLLVVHTLSLVSRTFLSIYVAQLDGRLVKSIVEGNVPRFLGLIVNWVLIAIPATFVNSLIRYLECKLALHIRTRLTSYTYSLYFRNQTYYRVSNLDGRLSNPDHSLTEDLQAFSSSLTHIYSHISKPILDVLLMVGTLVAMARKRGQSSNKPSIIALSTIAMTATILKIASPQFGKLVAEEARRNGFLRYLHSRIITNSEEIAFYAGHRVRERGRERERERGYPMATFTCTSAATVSTLQWL